MGFNFNIIVEYAPFLLKGTLVTIGLSLSGILIGTLLGLAIGLGKMVKNKWLASPFHLYVTFFRGTPLFVQILLIHFGVVPLFNGETNGFAAAIIALSLNAAAYIAEIFRAGIQSLENGQMEAARSLGMSNAQAMRHVILPQAFTRMIPPLGNEFIVLLKESSLASIVTAPEIMYWARAMNGQYYKVWEPYLSAALIYLLLTMSLSYLLTRLERRLETA
ncbi:amino acid ABC transporter permease [Mesobacillus zeae]|uniref:Amino acid ABC transporter permease n=1 Tax=Mesobacillus zeae TaxID=1917180 RepID=A0A398B6L3_9BACI|nr:amino acid ABC transporter permease [Mesobacillus zeae]RID84448.1 amino acid ABC transporter permease [Mesobacillus zeae]